MDLNIANYQTATVVLLALLAVPGVWIIGTSTEQIEKKKWYAWCGLVTGCGICFVPAYVVFYSIAMLTPLGQHLNATMNNTILPNLFLLLLSLVALSSAIKLIAQKRFAGCVFLLIFIGLLSSSLSTLKPYWGTIINYFTH